MGKMVNDLAALSQAVFRPEPTPEETSHIHRVANVKFRSPSPQERADINHPLHSDDLGFR